MKRHDFTVETGRRQMTDITAGIESILSGTGGEGLVTVFIPHATAGVAIMEMGSGSDSDLTTALVRIFPRDDRYVHAHGSKGHGADHIIPAFVSPSVTIPAHRGRLELGTWQSVVLVDPNVDNPTRRVEVRFLEG